MNPYVFIDTETTSLGPDRLAWEVAMIRCIPGQPDATEEVRMFVDGLDLSDANPASLRIGKFYDRHPRANGTATANELAEAFRDDIFRPTRNANPDLMSEQNVMAVVEHWTRGATLVGAAPWFDAEVLANRMRAHGLCPAWDHRLICVETLALPQIGYSDKGRPRGLVNTAEALDIEHDEADKHTALGDAALAQRIFEHLVGLPVPVSVVA